MKRIWAIKPAPEKFAPLRAGVLILCLCLLLGGCAPVLNRSHSSVTAHPQYSDADKDSGYLRAENYHQLVSAILFLVSQGDESGIIRLYDYTGSAESDLDSAYWEVIETDPFGAWAVDYIKYELHKAVSYYEVELTSIAYSRTPEQRAAVVSVTGVRAIPGELQQLFSEYRREAVYRVSYFEQGLQLADLEALILEGYYEQPMSAVGRPSAEVRLYPAESAGRQRMVEILIEYPFPEEEMLARKEALARRSEALLGQVDAGADAAATLAQLAQCLSEQVRFEADADRSDAYAALVEGAANEEGIALAAKLLCQAREIPCKLVFGTRQDAAAVWLLVSVDDGTWLHWNPSQERDGLQLHDDAAMSALGYGWE